MRVVISLLTLVPGISGGSETYARGLCGALARVGRHRTSALAPRLAPDAGSGLPTTVAAGFPRGDGTLGRLASIAGAAARPAAFEELLTDTEVVHYPLTVPVPRANGRATVVTLHDVQHLDLPELFDRQTRAFRRVAYDRAARRADAVVVISEFVRERALERLGLDRERIHVVPLGVDHTTFSPEPERPREPFLLYPARPWPHKNHARLFEAFTLLRRERPELRLVLTGAGHATTGLPEGVRARERVTTDELVDLYRRASALVFPSLYEGFGLPPLEAMACGCPVASSNAGALPEVCGDAAVLFDPHDPAAIAEGVRATLDRASELRALGLTHAATFTWDDVARAHDDVYEAAASGRRAT